MKTKVNGLEAVGEKIRKAIEKILRGKKLLTSNEKLIVHLDKEEKVPELPVEVRFSDNWQNVTKRAYTRRYKNSADIRSLSVSEMGFTPKITQELIDARLTKGNHLLKLANPPVSLLAYLGYTNLRTFRALLEEKGVILGKEWVLPSRANMGWKPKK